MRVEPSTRTQPPAPRPLRSAPRSASRPPRRRRQSSSRSRRCHHWLRAPRLAATRCGRRGGTPDAGEGGPCENPPHRAEPPKQHQNEDDDQNGADEPDAAVTETVAVAAEATAEATKQENDEDDNQDESQGHSATSFMIGPN